MSLIVSGAETMTEASVFAESTWTTFRFAAEILWGGGKAARAGRTNAAVKRATRVTPRRLIDLDAGRDFPRRDEMSDMLFARFIHWGVFASLSRVTAAGGG